MTIFDPHTERMTQLKDQYKVDVADTGVDAVIDSDLIVLAVKPQNADKVWASIRHSCPALLFASDDPS